jgi:hypothetical protein
LFPLIGALFYSLTSSRSVQPVSSCDSGNFECEYNLKNFWLFFQKSYLAPKKSKKSKIKFFGLSYPSQPRKWKKSDQKRFSENLEKHIYIEKHMIWSTWTISRVTWLNVKRFFTSSIKVILLDWGIIPFFELISIGPAGLWLWPLKVRVWI